MATWTAFPHTHEYAIDAASIALQWSRLHDGDQEPLPANEQVLAAWALFHQGEFRQACDAGLQAGPEGITVANKACCIYANYLEPKEKTKLDLFLQVAERAACQATAEPGNANAFYWQAYALGRYSQGISVSKALAQGLGSKVKMALEQTIRLQPLHADAHIALGTFHAEVIDKVGPLIGNMTYGAKKDTSLAMFKQGLQLTPNAPIALVEYANALIMLEGDQRMEEATQLYERAASCNAQDAVERLDVDLAQAELAS